MESEAILELCGLGFRYPGVPPDALREWALQGIDLSLHSGQRIALLGSNGSGKSTLLQHLNGLLRPTAGQVLHRGKPIEYGRQELHDLRRSVGFVFQDPDDQIFASTVAEDVSFGPVNLGLPASEVEARVEEALACLGIAECADLPPNVLSQGTRKKVAIAGALATHPSLLVLDEPTAGLDPASQDELELCLREIAQAGCAVCLSTHDVELALRWATHVAVLYEGTLAAFGFARDVLAERALLRSCRLRPPHALSGMARVGGLRPTPRPASLHVLFLHPSARLAAMRAARDLGADLHVHEMEAKEDEPSFERLAERVADLWDRASGLVVFAPTGIVVRSIAPLLGHKLTDPAVVCCDVHGRWAVSLVSGHEGGANRLAAQVASSLEAEPIITTTSEAARVHVAGIGCRRGVPVEILREALSLALEQVGLKSDDLRLLATSEAKREEPGMVALADELELPLRLLSHREIRSLRPRVRRSAASRHFHVPAVSEPAALLSGKRTQCILKKFIHRGVTVSIARELCAWSESDPATRSTGPAAPKPPSPHPPS